MNGTRRDDPPVIDWMPVGSTWDSRQRCFIDPDGVRYALMYISRCAKPDHECDWSAASSDPGRFFDCPWCAGIVESCGSYLQRYLYDERKRKQEILF